MPALPVADAVLDACVLINLAASGHLPAALAQAAGRCWVAKAAAAETLYLRGAAAGDPPEPLSIEKYLQPGVLDACDLASGIEEALFVEFALELDDGEAMSLAVAEARGYILFTDDAKARRIASARQPPVLVVGTPEILRHWAGSQPAAVTRAALQAIEHRARYRPAPTDSQSQWWRATSR